jgi:SAM-dependent methyltransferase
MAKTSFSAYWESLLGRFRKQRSDERLPDALPRQDTVVTTHDDASYQARVSAEIATFENDIAVHNLPEIFHYWSNKYLLPTITPFGFIHPDDFFIRQMAKIIEKNGSRRAAFISIGAGNCDTEVRVAQGLIALGHENFSIDCLDLNSAMLARGVELARQHGLETYVVPVEGDFNRWQPARPYDAVIANQSLHHVLDLEHLFDSIASAIAPADGVLITSDMIGRNGHQRWPEALSIVEEYWKTLPDKYKFNQQLKRLETTFVNWDCATDGFEGIRAQDILPLLSQRFHFDLFVPFANVIAPFVDRSFGHNFDVNSEADRAFIDQVHARDDAEIRAGHIKPTQMFAVLSLDARRPMQCIDGLTPEFCTRIPH